MLPAHGLMPCHRHWHPADCAAQAGGKANPVRHIKLWIVGGLLAVLGLFAFQNIAQVELTVLFWSFQTSRIVVIGSSFLLGGVVGWLLKAFWHPGARR
tara:strand:- start:8653 stop:8946 length:294 start_codon:yes stop_codon:yes gene_type:complete